MTLVFKRAVARSAAVAVTAMAVLAVTGQVGKAYLAELLSHHSGVRGLRLALQLDPKNSDYRRSLGRLYQYSLESIDPDGALQQLDSAARLNPYDPEVWLDLGAALELQARIGEAEACLRRADFLAPNLPGSQWAIANFFLLHGNVDEAFRHFKVVLSGTDAYTQAIFNTAWKASNDPRRILDELIPNQAKPQFDYLYFLLGHERWAEADDVWARIAASSEKFTVGAARPYIDTLIYTLRRPDQAYQAWSELFKKGLIQPTEDQVAQTLIFNGHFEQEPTNLGFDWRVVPMEGVYAGLDETAYRSAGHSLLIQFSGRQNVDYRNVYQLVQVRPNHPYRLTWSMKTEGITTDSGLRMEVRDLYDPPALDRFSDSLVGTTEGWSTSTLDFKTGPKTQLVQVSIARLPSGKLDNQIAGKAWVDDVSLVSTKEEMAPAKTSR
jgi:tetratricopeptide (TPR) repeat protein